MAREPDPTTDHAAQTTGIPVMPTTYIDRHLHLSAGTSPVTLWELVSEAGLKTPAKTFWEFRDSLSANHVLNHQQYLDILHTIDTVQSSPRAIERCAYDCFSSSYLHNCRELELRWNPVKRSQHGRIDLDRLIVAARSGMERAEATFGIHGRMLLCLGRDCTEAENAATFNMALRYHNKGISGIDVAGPEDKPLFQKLPELRQYYLAARASKMITTCHCGEGLHHWTQDELAWVLEELRPNRLGHGIQMHRFPRIMKMASQMGTELEICLTSNLTTKVVKNLKAYQHILRTLEANQVKFSFHTDGTHPLNTNIEKEHQLAASLQRP